MLMMLAFFAAFDFFVAADAHDAGLVALDMEIGILEPQLMLMTGFLCVGSGRLCAWKGG